MRISTRPAILCLLTALATGCSAAARRNALTFFFDGVPPPKTEQESRAASEGAREDRSGSAPGSVVSWDHGPYAAKLCAGCHEAGATNALVAPKVELCFRCHQLKLDKRVVHGPLASGGCLVCHDAHSSRYRYLLVSESTGFCFYCHDRKAVERVEAHAGGEGSDCTACHDPHMSDRDFLLK